jgi:hypothetical protein
VNLRELAEADLAATLEDPDDFGLPVLLIDPDGVEHGPYYGQVLYDTRGMDETGIEVTQHTPVVTLRRSTLTRIPLASEKNRWAVKIPTTPSLTAAKETFILGHPSEDGGSIGFIRLYLTKTAQS